MRKRILIILTVLAICLGLAACGSKEAEVPSGPVSEGDEMRDFTGTLSGGGEITLSDFDGKVILLNFWATWCGPCVGEMPAFPRLMEKYGDDLKIVAVNIGEDGETVQNFLTENGYTDLTVVLDEDYSISDLYPTDGIPYTLIIDRDGNISTIHLGAGDADEMFDEYCKDIDAVL